MSANVQDLTLEIGEGVNSTQLLGKTPCPASLLFSDWWVGLFAGVRELSNCGSISAFAFGFQVLGMSVMNKVCNIFDIFEYKYI